MKAAVALFPAVVLLAACERGPGTTISITGDNASAGIVNGTASIDVPGFKGELKLPKVQLDADNLDLNGAKLFPGSTLGNIDVDARGRDDGRVRVAFESPAGVDTVRQYLVSQFTAAGFKVSADGSGLSGTTDDGKPMKVTLAAAGPDKARGEIAFGN